MYSVTVTFYGQPQHIFEPPLTLVLPVLFHGLIALAVQVRSHLFLRCLPCKFPSQTFFVYRVRVVSGKWAIPVVCSVLNLGRLGCLLMLFAKLWQKPLFTLLTTTYNSDVIAVSSLGPGVEITVAASLLYYLWNRRGADFSQ
jgi:hypothetical protein